MNAIFCRFCAGVVPGKGMRCAVREAAAVVVCEEGPDKDVACVGKRGWAHVVVQVKLHAAALHDERVKVPVV